MAAKASRRFFCAGSTPSIWSTSPRRGRAGNSTVATTIEPTASRGQDNWRVRLTMANLWGDAINKHGGDARLVHLPEIGIRGNTHFLMSDLNNGQIADQVSQFLAEKKLD